MSQGQGGQIPGGATGGGFDDLRRRLGELQNGRQPVQAGGQNPTPPGPPMKASPPIQTTVQPAAGAPSWVDIANNPYGQAPQPQGGTGPKTAQPPDTGPATQPGASQQGRRAVGPAVEPGAEIGPKVPPPQERPSTTEMTGKPAGGVFQQPQQGRRALGPESRPTPQNPSPNGPARLGGPVMKPAVGGAPVGGFAPPNWGVAGSGSAGMPNTPGTAMPANPYGQKAPAPTFNGGTFEPAATPAQGTPRRPVGDPGSAGGYSGGVSV